MLYLAAIGIDQLLASDIVITALRVAIVAVCGYVVVCVLALTASRRWLSRLGPLEVAGADEIDTRYAELVAENQKLKAKAALTLRAAAQRNGKIR